MKKITAILSLTIITLMISSFKSPMQSSYGPWKTTSCFKGLDYCVKRASYNEYNGKYEWLVKFRNRYQEKVNFSFTAKESSVSSARTSNRISIRSGGEDGTWFYLAEANSINVFVDQMRFGEDDFSKYASCDN